ncbi:MAG TPA: 2OG-Fe(II) oxygenase [Gammaproteobacteria bacterium]|nr:2OG-Fe(II) oxygenase [Gammaproteobacteria bacterium]
MNEAPDIHDLSIAAQAGQPEAQYRLGALYFSRGEINAALDWLSRAAENNVSDAQNLLGIIHLNGIGTPCHPLKAVELFRAAANLDLKEAHFNLASLLFCGSVIENDDNAACRHLLRAAELRHRPALRVLGYLYSITSDAASQKLSSQCLAAAALLGDAHSEYALGTRYLEGAGVKANLEEGVYWLIQAANKNLYCAGSRLKSLIGEIGEARIHHIMQQHIPEVKEHATHSLELRHPDITIRTLSLSNNKSMAVSEYPQILADNLCDYLVNLAAPRLLPSGVVNPITGNPLKTKLRTSSSMNYQLSMYDMVVGYICRRLSALVGMPASHAEPISVLRYLPGEEYKPHYDYFTVDEHSMPQVQDANGQRTVTVFMYLNKVDAGGETEFPRLAIKVLPEKGTAVAFLNCDAKGQPDLDTLHAGLPVIRGEKWLATVWFRERPFIWI